MMLQVKVVNKKLVKPCTPTPENLKNYKLSFIDELMSPNRFRVLLFYDAGGWQQKRIVIINSLEESLAKVQVPFYPLAGRLRIKDGYVDCSDEGAEFIEAEAPPHADVATLLLERNLQNLDGLMPCNVTGDYPHDQAEEATYPIMSIQITHLRCGGLVIGISVSHRVFDAASLGTFIAAWSNATDPAATGRGATMEIVPVLGFASLLFPAKIRNDSQTVRPRTGSGTTVVAKRFAFNEEAIARLRSNLKPKVGVYYSRVRVVCSFIVKCLIRHGGTSSRRRRPCYIGQSINIRERTIPPLSKHSCGNLVLGSCMEIPEFPCPCPDMDMGIQELVDLMSDVIDKVVVKCGEMLCVGEDRLKDMIMEPLMKVGKALQSGEADLIWFTDWSKFGFNYVDFGWGKPVWASVVSRRVHGTVVLMENKEGNGVEAWVFWDKNDMALFEQDHEQLGLLGNLT